jgi:NAD(P)-dependent dehydrogenase (short-subunit alcohol dehydrogenase family)
LSQLLRGKVVVVTGGAGLLGREFCAAIADQGGLAIVADFDMQSAKKVAEAISKGRPGLAEPCGMDITSSASVCESLDRLLIKHGRLDAVVNNAYPRNRNYGKKFEEVTYEDFCENVSANLGGYFLVSQQAIRRFKAQGYGSVVNMASIYGVVSPRFEIYAGTNMTMPIEYAAIKSGVIHLTKYMTKYLRGTGIRVNAISPGGVLDDQPLEFLERYKAHCLTKGMLVPADLTGTLIYLLSDMSQFVNGQNILVDDGFSL